MDDALNEIFQEGYQAFHDQVPSIANPYERPDEIQAWQDGWQEAWDDAVDFWEREKYDDV